MIQPATRNLFILPLDAAEATIELVGGKGASLARMSAAKLPVPAGFQVTTTAYRRFVESNDLQADIPQMRRTPTLLSIAPCME
jgi:phosphoenolpyruvate synthase/pyruvate phosphate dikinase